MHVYLYVYMCVFYELQNYAYTTKIMCIYVCLIDLSIYLHKYKLYTPYAHSNTCVYYVYIYITSLFLELNI